MVVHKCNKKLEPCEDIRIHVIALYMYDAQEIKWVAHWTLDSPLAHSVDPLKFSTDLSISSDIGQLPFQ